MVIWKVFPPAISDRHSWQVIKLFFLVDETESLVTAHLSSEGVLSAVITTSNDTYHIEPSHHYIREPHPFHMVAYARSQVKQRLNATQFDFVVPSVSDYQQQGPGAISKHHTILSNTGMGHRTTSPRLLRRQTIDGGRENSCNMILIADLSALRLFMDVQSASSQLVGHVRITWPIIDLLCWTGVADI